LKAADIFKRIKPLWSYEKDIENIFWGKYPVFTKTNIKDQNMNLKVKYLDKYTEISKDFIAGHWKKFFLN
jgi:hypothetical protein